MAVRNYQDPRAGLAFLVDYRGAICVDFCGKRTMVKVTVLLCQSWRQATDHRPWIWS